MEFDLIIDLLRSDGSIIVNKKLARSIGIDAAIMYSELLSKYNYFRIRDELTSDEFFFNTVENMELDTTLSKYQQAKAIKLLVKLGLIININKGLPQKRYFKIVNDADVIKNAFKPLNQSNSKKTEQLEVKKLDGNNTKSNNTKLICSKKQINRKPTKRNKSEYSNYALDKTAEFANVLVNGI